MNKKISAVLKELEALNQEFQNQSYPKKYQKIIGTKKPIRLWPVPRTTAQLLRLLVLVKKPKIILELGTSGGYSAIWLASAAREYEGKVYTIEFFKPKIKLADYFFRRSGLKNDIIQLSGQVLEVLKTWNKKIDFLFIDADKKGYFEYLKKFEPFLNPGAMIVADNAINFADLMKDYLDYVQTSPDYFSYLLNVDNGILISVKL